MPVYQDPKSVDITESSLWKENGYINKNYNDYSYYQLRSVLKIPIVYRSAMAILQTILSQNFRITCTNSRAEKWINNAIEPVWEKIITGASGCYWYGFQVGELYYHKGQNGKYYPKIKFPFPDYIEVRLNDNNDYIGFRQRSQKRTIEVDGENSVLWTFGVGIHGNPYGYGILDSIYKSATNYSRILDKVLLMADRQNWPVTIIDVPGDGANSDSIDDFVKDLANLPYKDIPFSAFKNYSMDRKVEIFSVAPQTGAIQESLKAADQYLRDIGSGMLVSLRTFYNSPNDGGSYNLVSVQQSEFDRIVRGMWRVITPGIEKIIKRTLEINFGKTASENFELDIEYFDEVTRLAARDILSDTIQSIQSSINYPKLLDLAGLPGLIDKDIINAAEEE